MLLPWYPQPHTQGFAPLCLCIGRHSGRLSWIHTLILHMHLAYVGTPPDSGVVWCGVVCRRRCYQMVMAGMVSGNASW